MTILRYNSSTAFAGLVITMLLTALPGPGIAQPQSPAAAPEGEVRALWVVRNTLTSPEKIYKMV